jgi:hypothetical protein
VSKIPPAAWQDPEAFEPEEVREVTEEEPEPDDGSFKKIAEEDDESVQDPQQD